MYMINKELLEKIKEYNEVYDYISIVVDYKKEEEIVELRESIVNELGSISESAFTDKDISAIFNIVDDEDVEEYYLYKPEEVMEILYPSDIDSNEMLHSAFGWIPSKQRVEWIVLNPLAGNEWYNIIDNVNNNYIASSIPLDNF